MHAYFGLQAESCAVHNFTTLSGIPSSCSDMNCTASTYVKYLHMCAANRKELWPDKVDDLNNTAYQISRLHSECERDLQESLESYTSIYKQKCLTLTVLSSLEQWLRECFWHLLYKYIQANNRPIHPATKRQQWWYCPLEGPCVVELLKGRLFFFN